MQPYLERFGAVCRSRLRCGGDDQVAVLHPHSDFLATEACAAGARSILEATVDACQSVLDVCTSLPGCCSQGLSETASEGSIDSIQTLGTSARRSSAHAGLDNGR